MDIDISFQKAPYPTVRGHGSEVIKLFLFSTQLSMKLILIVGILTFICRINDLDLKILLILASFISVSSLNFKLSS